MIDYSRNVGILGYCSEGLNEGVMLIRTIIGIAGIFMLCLAGGASAQRACNTYVISNSRYEILNFYGDRDMVIETVKGKTASDSLNIQVQNCNPQYYFVYTPGGQRGLVKKGDVVLSDRLIIVECDTITIQEEAKRRAAGNGASGTPICRSK